MSSIRIRDETSSLLVITVMTAVECLLLCGVIHTCPGTMMIGARTAMSGPQGSMRGQSSFRIESTGADITERVMAEIFRVEAEQLFLAQSVLAEPLDLLKFLRTTGWQLA